MKARRILLATAASTFALVGTASAGGFHAHFGGGVHWGGGAHWGGGYGGGYRAPHVHWHGGGGTVVVRGGIWVGGGGGYWGGYYDPYYYPTYTYATPPTCECGPTYYPPVYPQPTSYAAMPAPQPAPMPSFGVGMFVGGTTTQTQGGDVNGNDVGLFANLRITRGLLIQGELGKTTLDNSARVDKRFEGALVWEIGAENSWAPYLLGGLGVESADTSNASATQNFGEVGIGLRWAISRGFHLTADIRAGSRSTMSGGMDAPPPATTLSTSPTSVAPPPADGQSEDFTRVRLGAMLYF